MADLLSIRGTTRTRKRIGTTYLPVDGTPVTVDLDNAEVRRDLARGVGYWVPAVANMAGQPVGTHTFDIGDEAANVIDVAVQLKDAAGEDLAAHGAVRMFLSSDAAGETPVDPSANVVVSITDGDLLSAGTSTLKVFEVLSDDAGLVTVRLTNSADADISRYLHVISPLGGLVSSEEIVFVDDTP